MPIIKEFTIRLEDRPGTLGKLCQSLAEQDINILAYQHFPHTVSSTTQESGLAGVEPNRPEE